MNNYLKDYQDYYRLRMQRYEGNAEYANSYQSEKAIYEAIASCTTLDEFKDKLGNLNEKNAIALVLDQYNIQLKHYTGMNEPIKADGCKRFLEKASTTSNVQELITMINEEENKTSLAVTADTIQPFPDLGYIERSTIWAEAEVPEKYKQRYAQYAVEEKEHMQAAYTETTRQLNNWQPGWSFSFERILEERHRRLLPVPDDVLRDYIETTKTMLYAGR